MSYANTQGPKINPFFAGGCTSDRRIVIVVVADGAGAVADADGQSSCFASSLFILLQGV